VRFETNIPQRVTLKFAEGREVEGQFGAQFLPSLLPEGQVYFAPVVEDKLRELAVKDGEAIEVCKREVRGDGNRKRTEWQVNRIGQPSSPAAPAPSVPEPSAPRNHNAPGGAARLPQDIPLAIPMDRAMTMFLIAAGRSTREAEQVLGSQGGSVRFDSRDIASLATTCLIHSFNRGWVSWLEPKTAQAAVAEAKIQALKNEIAKPTVEFKPAASAWSTRGEMKAVFERLREIVGEVEYAKEMERAGVSSPAEFHYLNKARESYSRLVAIAQQEAA
jgi:hypothetical protein